MNIDTLQSCESCGLTVDQISLWTYRGETKCEACFKEQWKTVLSIAWAIGKQRKYPPPWATIGAWLLCMFLVLCFSCFLNLMGIYGWKNYLSGMFFVICLWAVAQKALNHVFLFRRYETLRKLR